MTLTIKTHPPEKLLAALDADPHAGAQGGLEAVRGAGDGPRLEVLVAIPRPRGGAELRVASARLRRPRHILHMPIYVNYLSL